MATTFGAVDVAVRFIADASSVQKEVDKVSGTGDKIKSFAKGAALAIGGAFAVNAVTDWIGAAEEANAVSAKLQQTLANAGDATGEWAKHAEDLAGSLQYKTGIDDEVIKSGQTILATFHDVSGAVGQQSGIFDRATKAALDMSKAGFGSVDSASTMLGKALQDPERGLTALGRAGVTFSQDQKDAIKAMVETGDKAGAMNAIMANVESQVGGVAEKSATAGDKMKVAWGETQEALGNALLPVLETLAPVVAKLAQFVQENATWLVPMVAGIIALNIALSLSPIMLIVIGIGLLIAGLILLWQNWDTVWNAILALLGVVADFFISIWQSVANFFIGLWNSVAGFFIGLWQTVIGAFVTAWESVIGFFQGIWNTILAIVQSVIDWLIGHWQIVLAIITGPFGIAVGIIISYWDQIMGVIRSIPGWIASALAAVGSIIVAPFQWAWDQIVRIKDSIVGAFSSAVDGLKNIWNGFARFWNGIELEIPGVTMPGPIPDIPGFTVGLPDLPMLARGGIVTGPTLALLGEAGREAVIPLDRMPSGGDVYITVQTTGLGADAPQIQSAVVNALRGYVSRNGTIPNIAAV